MIWILSWLFPLWALLPRARRLGAVTFTEVTGVGWQCSIRPNHDSQTWNRRGLNSWRGTGRSLGASVRDALTAAGDVGKPTRDGSEYAPKIGGEAHDLDDR